MFLPYSWSARQLVIFVSKRRRCPRTVQLLAANVLLRLNLDERNTLIFLPSHHFEIALFIATGSDVSFEFDTWFVIFGWIFLYKIIYHLHHVHWNGASRHSLDKGIVICHKIPGEYSALQRDLVILQREQKCSTLFTYCQIKAFEF